MEQQTIAALRRQAEKRNESMEGGARWRTLDFVLSLILIMLSVFALRTVLFDPVRVDGKSMLDTLTDGEIMLVNRAAFAFSQPKRGDIVLCYYPDDYYAQPGKTYGTRVKRVVAVGGDTIEAKNGTLYLNGEAQDEPFLTPERIGAMTIARQVIPEGSVFVLGDNREVSIDSRDPNVGPIPLSRVIGKVRLVMYPLTNLRFV